MSLFPPVPFACRPGCAVCCTTISISSPLPGMPAGKPAGIRCVNLDSQNRCVHWETPRYPAVCRQFVPTLIYCGNSTPEAIALLGALEIATAPQPL